MKIAGKWFSWRPRNDMMGEGLCRRVRSNVFDELWKSWDYRAKFLKM
jgi:hypothetical protein